MEKGVSNVAYMVNRVRNAYMVNRVRKAQLVRVRDIVMHSNHRGSSPSGSNLGRVSRKIV